MIYLRCEVIVLFIAVCIGYVTSANAQILAVPCPFGMVFKKSERVPQGDCVCPLSGETLSLNIFPPTSAVFGGCTQAQSCNVAFATSSAESTANSYTDGIQQFIDMDSFSDGGYVAFWESNQESLRFYGVYGKIYDAQGNEVVPPAQPYGAPFAQTNEIAANSFINNWQIHPSVAVLSNDNFVVVWRSEGQDGQGWGLYGKMFTKAGAEVTTPLSGGAGGGAAGEGNEFRINSQTNGDQGSNLTYSRAEIAALNNGGFVVVWIDYNHSPTAAVMAAIFDQTGSKIVSDFKVNDANYSTNDPSVTVMSDGSFVVAWQSLGQITVNDNNIYAKRFAADGTAIAPPAGLIGVNNAQGNEFSVNSYTTQAQQYPSITSLVSGGFAIAWSSLQQDGDGWGVYAKLYAADGEEITTTHSGGLNGGALGEGAEFVVNDYTTGNQGTGHYMMPLFNGGFLIGWDSMSQRDSGNIDIYAKMYDMNGNEMAPPQLGVEGALGNEFIINAPTSFTYTFAPSFAMLSNGNIVAGFAGDSVTFYDIFTKSLGWTCEE